MINTVVAFKDAGDKTVEFALELNVGEVVVSSVLGEVTPVTVPPLDATLESALDATTVELSLTGGLVGSSYGFPVTVTTNQRVFVLTVAVSVEASVFQPYAAIDPTSFSDLLGSIDAGNAALATAVFMFPSSVDTSTMSAKWELMDELGTVHSAGTAFEIKQQNLGPSKSITARFVLSVPTSTPPSLDKPYIVRYTLSLANDAVQTDYYSYESLEVAGLALVPLGVQSSVEMHGDNAELALVADRLYDTVSADVFYDNVSLGTITAARAEKVASGYRYTVRFDTTGLIASLEPYVVVWKYGNALQGSSFRETASLWVINPAISTAMEDVKSKVNKARQTLYGVDHSQFAPDALLLWLRRGRDSFNSSYGVFTSFTMTNAKGGIREYWLMYAELMALDSQYLLEGEQAFNFSGANISLDVDRTSFLDSAASKIQSRLDNEFKAMKQVMVMRGCTSGDGSQDPARLARGAIGAVGITISPANSYGPRLPFLRNR